MLLSELAEELTNWLASSPEKWCDEPVSVRTELDPLKCIGNTLGVFLVPNFTGYTLTTGNARPRKLVLSIPTIQYVSLVISKVFLELPTGDGVANWSEAKVIIDVRERAERYLLQYYHPDVLIATIEPNDIEEQSLENRNFISMTTFGYQEISCASASDLNSLSEGSRLR